MALRVPAAGTARYKRNHEVLHKVEELNRAKIETLPEEHTPSGRVHVTRCRCGDLDCTALLSFDGSTKAVAVGGGYMTLQCAIKKGLITREKVFREMKSQG